MLFGEGFGKMTDSKKFTSFVDPFWGNGVTRGAKPEGIAKNWYAFKGMAGNTHPGAQLPFGKLSVCAYSGGYSTGYGNNRANSGEPIVPLYEGKKIFGLSHLHHSGVGGMGYYYNYALTSVFYGELSAPVMNDLTEETARPGYYSGTAAESGVKYEGTVSENAVYHRYTLKKAGARLMVDLSNDGLYKNDVHPRLNFDAGEARLKIIDEKTVLASVVLEGLTLHFCIHSSGGGAALWRDYEISDEREISTSGVGGHRFGCVFNIDNFSGTSCLTISAKSEEKALNDNIAARDGDFDKTAEMADRLWEKRLSAIEIKGGEREKRLFYSILYHSLTKPSNWQGESPYYEEEDFMSDVATLWDIYKTQLPLLNSIYQDISERLVRTYMNFNKYLEDMPNSIGLIKDRSVEAKQARLLASYLFCDAYYRGVPGIDYKTALLSLADEMKNERYSEFFVNGECARTTHTLDIAECCGNVAEIAGELGISELKNELLPYSRNWRAAFDKNSGVLREESEYYEGNHWNYAFRPLRDMDARIGEYGGVERFAELLDRFFGYTHPESIKTRFEGFNNETDMEAPYAYVYADRHDRLCEVVDLGRRCMFTEGEGGAPGNCDSGGLTACYIWNAIGLFPVAGQDLMLIGTPSFEESVLKLSSGKDFTVKRRGEGIYVKNVTLDGEMLCDMRMSVRRMMQGGVLLFEMTDVPPNI